MAQQSCVIAAIAALEFLSPTRHPTSSRSISWDALEQPGAVQPAVLDLGSDCSFVMPEKSAGPRIKPGVTD